MPMPLLVSIIIPCRNEEKYIGKCLDSLIKQDYPKENLEILVVNGMSEDKTREILEKYASQYSFIKILENPEKFTPFGLNIGIKQAKGEIIIRIDAHAAYEKDYVSKCVRYLRKFRADNVGGIIKTLPAKNTLTAQAIAACLSHPFGAASRFRIGAPKPKWVDTVFGGCYKKRIFKKVGFFNEKLTRSQDLEFNLRLKKAGGKILLVPEIIAYYYPSSTFRNFLSHNFCDGVWVIYPLKFGIRAFSSRHLLPLALVLSVLGALLLSLISKTFFFIFLFILLFYLFISIFFAFEIAENKKNLKYMFLMPIAFACRHFGYGAGSIFGFIKLLIK